MVCLHSQDMESDKHTYMSKNDTHVSEIFYIKCIKGYIK